MVPAPLALTDRIGAGLLWALILVGGVIVLTAATWRGETTSALR